MTESSSSPLKTTLVCGFLGAGKTTFILDRLKISRGRTAVLVNEFGALGVDGTLIRSAGGIDVVEMPGGCICCSQQAGLTEALGTVAAEIRPDALFIEPSGVAEASEILKVLAEPELTGRVRLEAVIAVIDAATFLEYAEPEAFGPFFLDQVTNADLVLLNKADLISPEERERVSRRLQELNPSALSVSTSFCRMEGPLPSGSRREIRSSGCSGPAMECVGIAPETPLSEHRLAELSSALVEGRFGRIFRVKGFLPVATGSVLLQMAGEKLSTSPFPLQAPSRLTLIGYDLDGAGLREFFASEGNRP